MKNILIIGCGLLGSSLVRRISKKKIAKKIFVYEKSKKNILKIKKLKLPGTIIKSLKDGVVSSDMIIFCTPMSEYKKLILKINSLISSKTLITDIGSSKIESSKIIRKFLKKGIHWTRSHPITGSEVSGPEHGKHNLFENKWCVLIKDKNTNLKHLKTLNSFWKKVGSKTVIMDSQKHDKIFSVTSHLPHLIAYNLVKSAPRF
jgi:Prephenate dehydrogenase